MSPGADRQTPLIIVLLPVYNGERFLDEQIGSILGQSHKNLQLVFRDDGSTDTSPAILQKYASVHPDQVLVLQDDRGNLGALGSFSVLMQWALKQPVSDSGVYVALADQDDTWHPDKLQQCLQAMTEAEGELPEMPLLVHSDLKVVDATGGEMSASLMQYQGLDPGKTKFGAQLISNTVTGCTSLANLALLEKALPVPADAVMHDWWLSLVASAFGRLIFLPAALVEYRQHGRNTLGAREHKSPSLSWRTVGKLFQFKPTKQAQMLFEQAAAQAAAFESAFGDQLAASDRRAIRDVMLLPQLGLWQQRILFRRLTRKSAR